MSPSCDVVRIRTTLSLVVVAVLTGAYFPSTALAQGQSLPVNLPDGPAKDGFDIERFSNLGNGWFETFYVERTEALQDVLQQGRVATDTPVLVLETAAGPLALVNDQMVFHHIAQGRAGDKDWMATFWVVCNSGISLVPTIDGTVHHFDNVGLYDALFVMQDQETKTLWNHITGEALYGPLVGRTLGPMGNFLQMSVEQALVREPMTAVAISDSPYFVNGQPFGRDGPIAGGRGRGAGGRGRPGLDNPNVRLSAGFIDTLGTEDTRLERMEMGLGVVTEDTVRFYPMNVIRERGALVDAVDGRNLLIFIDQSTFTPAALFVEASSATLVDREIHLDTGGVVRMGALFDAAGDQVDAIRPQQLFSRWYGFALTFPGSQIFGQ